MTLLKSGYFYLLLTIVFTVTGQLVMKWGVSRLGQGPQDLPGGVKFIISALLHPGVMGGLLCAFAAAVSWMLVLPKLPLSVAYPFMALPIVLVLALTPVFFRETVTLNQWLGVGVVALGLWVTTR